MDNNTPTLRSPAEIELHIKAAERFINNTNENVKKYQLFNYILLIPSAIILCLIILYSFGYSDMELELIVSLLGAGTLFTSLTFFALNQLQKCWCCKNSCNIATYHLDLHDPVKAFQFMRISECLKQGANAANINISNA